MPGRHQQPDHALGDANTVGGYLAVHARPAAFEGPDGLAYSVEIATDRSDDPERPWGAFLMFLRWRRMGEPGIAGHLETPLLALGRTADDARALVGAMPLSEVRATLERLVRDERGTETPRKWWEVMRDEDAS